MPELEQLGPLPGEGGIDKTIGKGSQVLRLWRRFFSGMKERNSFKEDAICHPDNWTNMEEGFQYLKDSAVLM